MITSKLKKHFEKIGAQKGHTLPDDHFYQDIFSHIDRADHVISVHFGPAKTAILKEVFHRAIQNTHVWYVSDSLTSYQVFSLKSLLNGIPVSVMGDRKMIFTTPPVTLWDSRTLANLTADLHRFSRPGLVIFDDVDDLDNPDTGLLIQQNIAGMPEGVSILMMASPSMNSEQLVNWLQFCRNRPCRQIQPDDQSWRRIPVFLSSDWELLPLLDKRRLSSKVKRLIKESMPFKDISSATFIRDMVSFLKNAGMTPAIVVMDSAKSCDHAVNACHPVNTALGEVLTQPVIASILDQNPFVKEMPLLAGSLSRRVAPCHGDLHPLWRQLVEHFLVLDGIDVIFATVDSVQNLSTPVQSIVFCNTSPTGKEPIRLTRLQMARMTRLAIPDKNEQPACIVTLHSPHVYLVHIKDLLIEGTRSLMHRFHPDCRAALNIIARGGDPEKRLDQSLAGVLAPSFGEFCFEELETMLADELPEARCFLSLQTVASLSLIRLELGLQINKLDSDRLHDSGMTKQEVQNEKQILENILAQTPCEQCPHMAFCQKRGSRKFRNIMNLHEEMKEKLSGSLNGLKSVFRYPLRCLQEFELVTPSLQLTEHGHLALRTGFRHPQPFVECCRSGVLPMNDPMLFFALAGGFVESPSFRRYRQTDQMNENTRILKPFFQEMTPVLNRVMAQMLRFALLPHRFDPKKSLLLLQWKQGTDMDALAQQTGISTGILSSLIDRTTCLLERIALPRA